MTPMKEGWRGQSHEATCVNSTRGKNNDRSTNTYRPHWKKGARIMRESGQAPNMRKVVFPPHNKSNRLS
jgi:hypothetical protein